MIDFRDIKIDAQGTLGKNLFLVKTAPSFEYENGLPTQRVAGTRYTIACAGADMQTVSVKVPGPQTVQKRDDGTLQKVQFDGLELYLYMRDNRPLVGARATGIREVPEKQ